jgi:hypothetical protein
MNRALLFALLSSAATPPEGQPRIDRMAVVPVIVAGAKTEVTESSVLDSVVKAAVRRRGLRVMNAEELFVQEGMQGRIADCGTDAACIVERLAPLGAKMGLIIVVNLDVKPALLALLLADTDERQIVARTTSPIVPEREAVTAAILRSVGELLDRTGYARAGRLVVKVSPPDAIVDVEGERLTGPFIDVAPGRHQVHAARSGYADKTIEADASIGLDTEVALELESEPNLFGSGWFWAGAATVALIAGVSAAFLLTRKSAVCVCAGLPESMCKPCE